MCDDVVLSKYVNFLRPEVRTPGSSRSWRRVRVGNGSRTSRVLEIPVLRLEDLKIYIY